MSARSRAERIEGALLGVAVGDALGLPREGLSPRRASRVFGDELRHALLPGRGMLSDDTEHTCMVGQALLSARGDAAAFGRSLAWRLRGWLLGLPAGVGFATLRALLKLWIGFPPTHSGVRSAGNGPAMRAPLLGACLGDTEALRAHVRASTRLTHTDPRAEEGALAVALAAHAAAETGGAPEPGPFLASLLTELRTPELRAALEAAAAHLERGDPPAEFARAQGLERGVTGYVVHTVPVALYGWLHHRGDFAAALSSVVRLGGDADTTGAIVGGIAGAGAGAAGIPAPWLAGLCDHPRSLAWMRRLAAALALPRDDPARRPVPLAWPLLPLRNLLFLGIVLLHGFRRLLPPY
ncbi:MAG: ADP-ribosylglycohydrolase family protein [Planctomycetota bacterium]